MKKAVAVLMVAGTLCALAETETVGEYTWTYCIKGDAAKIFNGTVAAITPKPEGAVVVPATLGGKPVTSIGDWAFRDCRWCSRITLPDSAKRIGKSAFAGCSGLKNLTMPSVESIGNGAFSGCSGLKSLTMPSVTGIGNSAFSGCSGLTDVVMPKVTNIVDMAFNSCRALENVVMPNAMSVGRESFSGCWGLKNVQMQNIENIGKLAFNDCGRLTNMTDLVRVESIGEGAFHNCSWLASATMPNVKSIGKEAFYNCSRLKNVMMPNVKSIGVSAFYGCSGLESVEMQNVTSVGAVAFSGCGGIKAFSIDEANPEYKSVSGLLLTKDGKTLVRGIGGSVVIPNSVARILDGAFSGCRGLTNVTFGTGAAFFGKGVFSGCTGLAKVVFLGNAPEVIPADFYSNTPKSMVTYVEKGSVGWSAEDSKVLPEMWNGRSIMYIGQGDDVAAHESSTKATTAAVPAAAPNATSAMARPAQLLRRRFGREGSPYMTETVGEYTWTYRIKDDVAEIGNRGSVAISPKPKGTITVPSTLGGKQVTSIGNGAFSGCSWIKRVALPVSMTNIGEYVFSGCGALVNVEMPNVTEIGASAFSGCSGLASVTMPNVISVGGYAFDGCCGLKNVEMPNVTEIGAGAFSGCSGLKSVEMPIVTSIGASAFSGCSGLVSVTMPNVTSIGNEAFFDCRGLANVVMPKVMNIRNHAFCRCSVLASVEIPAVESICQYAFSECVGLANVALPASATNIAAGAFGGCSGITEFTVDEANPQYKSAFGLLLTKDGKTLVSGVNGKVIVPDSVTEVGDYAFAGFGGLTNVTFGIGAAYFGKGVFNCCYSLKKVLFLGNAPEAVPADFYSNTPKDLVTYVERDSVGWNGENSKELSEKWCDRPIKYISQEVQSNSKESSDQDAQIAIQGPIKNSILSGRRRRPNGTMQNKPAEEGLLEPALSLEEAVELAKKDDPRGYYQLAIVISQKQNWKDKSFDARGYIDLFLKKAVDAGYRNAQFLDVLLADNCLSGDVDSSSPRLFRSRAQGINGLTSPGQLIERYAGFKRGWWHCKGSLSSKDDVKAILDRYQKLVVDGCYQATNAIALLEWRAKRAEEKAAEEAAKMAESDEMANLVRSVAELPVKEKRNVSAEFAKEAKVAGALYIKSTEEGTKDLSWSVDEKKPLYFEFYDASEGWTRLLKFSADGRLLSVSPAQ